MIPPQRALVLLFLIVLFSQVQTTKISRDSTSRSLTRNKRFLVWKEGVNWIALIFGLGIPFEVDDESVTLGMVMKAYYQLPNNSTYYTRPTIDYERKRRATTTSRWIIYELLETALGKYYKDGKACLLKSICQVAAVQLEERAGILAEIVHAILTPSSSSDMLVDYSQNEYHAAEHLGVEIRDCNQLYPECPKDPVEQFSRLITVGKYMT